MPGPVEKNRDRVFCPPLNTNIDLGDLELDDFRFDKDRIPYDRQAGELMKQGRIKQKTQWQLAKHY